MIPADLDIWHTIAIALIFVMWASYSPVLSLLGHGTLNSQLHAVRQTWMRNVISYRRENRVIDGILLGHISSQMSYFGSATLLVMAGLVGGFAGINHLHATLLASPYLPQTTVQLFTFHYAALTLIIAMAFFSFTYALRKLAYTLAMIGGLPEAPAEDPSAQEMIDQVAVVLTDAVKSLNNGIRGYYFAIAALFLFAGPQVSIGMTLLVAAILYWRQGFSTTSLAIERYVEAMQKRNAANG
jgi:uncharacterized membrane protein